MGRKKRLKGFKDGYAIEFHHALRCPACRTPLLPTKLIVSSFPYLHADYFLTCLRCGYKAVFGVPEDPVIGMELIIWDTEPHKILKRALKEETPLCPFHNKKMRLTKIFGDLINTKEDVIRIQWKCPEWFLTNHITVPRKKIE